mgnify:CR=1 FL=1
MATGGFFTPNDNPSQQQLNDEELQAIMNTAHEWGKTVTAHVYSVDHMQKLIKYGIDGNGESGRFHADTLLRGKYAAFNGCHDSLAAILYDWPRAF